MRSSRGARAASIALAVVLAACDAPTVPADAPAYDPTQLTGGLYYRWAAGTTISVFVDTATGGVAGLDLIALARASAARWNGVSRYGEYELALVGTPRAADVVVRFRDAPPILDLTECPFTGGGRGRTLFCDDGAGAAIVLPLLDGGGGRVRMEVYVDPAAPPPAGLARDAYIGALLTHELGHVVGIGGHSPDPADIMNTAPQVTEPSADDRRTLRHVLRQRPDVRLR